MAADGLRRIYRWFATDQRRSWQGHTLVALAAGIVLSPLGWISWTPQLWLAIGATVAAVYYVGIREQLDEATHRARGDWDELDPGEGVTPRYDKLGDMTGPIAVTLATWTSWALSLLG